MSGLITAYKVRKDCFLCSITFHQTRNLVSIFIERTKTSAKQRTQLL